MKRIISFIIAMLAVFALSLPAYAAKPSMTLSVKKYDYSAKAYVKANGKAENGDLLLIELGISDTVSSIGAMRLKLTYNSSVAEFVDGGEFVYITKGTPLVTNKTSASNPEQSYVSAVFGADNQTPGTAIATNFKGNVVSYLFRCNATGVCRFTATFEEIYDKNYKSISIDKKQTLFVSVSDWQFADLPLFSALSNIKYPDSKTDIEAADVAYAKLSSAQKDRFKLNYPNEFNNYSTAWTRFYDLANAEAEAEIRAEANILLNSEDFLKIKDLTPEQINESNYQSAVACKNQYKKLSNAAKKYISDAVKETINNLYTPAAKIADIIKKQKSADEDAELFNSLYYNLKDLDDVAVRSGAESDLFLEQLRSATADIENLDIDIMSPDFKSQMEKWKSDLDHYNEIIEDELIKRGISKKVLEEIEKFTSKWSKVLKLHMLNVGVGDKTAIELMIEDYEKLSDEAKQQLSPHYNTAKQLLQIIEALGANRNTTVISNNAGQNSSQTQATDNSRNSGSDGVKTVETVKKSYIERGVSPFVKMIAVITAISVLSMFVPIGIQLFHRIKQQREDKE